MSLDVRCGAAGIRPVRPFLCPDPFCTPVRSTQDSRGQVESKGVDRHGVPADLERAAELCATYKDLELGLVDGVVAAVAERLGASDIATLDVRDFGALELKGKPRLLPRGR